MSLQSIPPTLYLRATVVVSMMVMVMRLMGKVMRMFCGDERCNSGWVVAAGGGGCGWAGPHVQEAVLLVRGKEEATASTEQWGDLRVDGGRDGACGGGYDGEGRWRLQRCI